MTNSNQLNQYYRRKQEFITILGGKCVDCGCVDNLEFDHINPKEKSFNISKNYSKNYDELLKEVLKCALRCKDCHKIKTEDIDGFKADHGTLGMYRHQKCRCDLCKKANSDYHREYKRKSRGMA